MLGSAEQSRQTVTVRVQVIDMESFTLDLQLPTYLPARDLTQRIARDAGLDAHWGDGRRRLYWLRARGKLVENDETLDDLGIVDSELVYLLPEPPSGSGVLEQPPDYPRNRGYAASGTVKLILALTGMLVWAVGWGLALADARTAWTVVLPGLAMGMMCTGFSRHAWGGRGSAPRVGITAVVVLFPAMFLALAVAVAVGDVTLGTAYSETVAGMIFGMVGVMVGWLAWWGAVEPLPHDGRPDVGDGEAGEVVALVPCGICGQGVKHEVRVECPYACGRFFHSGCYRARVAVARMDTGMCPICQVRVG
jgi:hypothetical protein